MCAIARERNPGGLLPVDVNSAESDTNDAESLSRIHALLVEDNAVNRLVASEYLKRAGCEVDVATHGHEAIDRCRRNIYDIVFMDCQMPEMDGFEATRMIRSQQVGSTWRVPIVALTANAMDQDREHCLAAGMDDFLIKPANQTAICDVLRRWVPPSRRSVSKGQV
jgi:CheY-like chemotaxis protein